HGPNKRKQSSPGGRIGLAVVLSNRMGCSIIGTRFLASLYGRLRTANARRHCFFVILGAAELVDQRKSIQTANRRLCLSLNFLGRDDGLRGPKELALPYQTLGTIGRADPSRSASNGSAAKGRSIQRRVFGMPRGGRADQKGSESVL